MFPPVSQPRRGSPIRYLSFFSSDLERDLHPSDWSLTPQSQNSPRRSKSIKHKNGELSRDSGWAQRSSPRSNLCTLASLPPSGDLGSSMGPESYKVNEAAWQSRLLWRPELTLRLISVQLHQRHQLRDAGARRGQISAEHGEQPGRASVALGWGRGGAPFTCSLFPQQCGVVSEHTKKMCTR